MDLQAVRQKAVNFGEDRKMAGIYMHLGCALLGFIAAKSRILGGAAPFGIGFCAGMSGFFAASAAVGAAAGYLLPIAGSSGFLYLGAILASVAVILITESIIKSDNHPIICGICGFAVTAGIHLAVDGFAADGLTVTAQEALLAGAGAFCIHKSSHILSKVLYGLKSGERYYLIFSFCAVFSGLYSLNFYTLNCGLIFAAALIPCSALFAGAGGGVLAGACAGLAYFLAFPAKLLPLAFFCFGGLIAGVFAPLGRFAAGLSFLAVGSICTLLCGITDKAAVMIIEAAFGTALFLIIPPAAGKKLKKIFCTPTDTAAFEGIKGALALRLQFAAETLCDVCDTLDSVSEKLEKQSSPDFEKVIISTKRDACKGCLMQSRCWETLRSDTVDAVIELAHFKRMGEKPELSEKTLEFGGRCNRMETVTNVLNRHYSEYLAKVDSEAKARQVRLTLSSQFAGMSRMLCDMGEEISGNSAFDLDAAGNISSCLYDMGLNPRQCSCRTDGMGRQKVEITAIADEHAVINRRNIQRIISEICQKSFAVPTVTRSKGAVLISACEAPLLAADTGTAQFCCPDSTVCGDSFNIFEDGKGRLILILSDGMGHGSTAALDSSLASGMLSRLIKAGFGYDCSLSVVNSSLLYKSTCESLATLDMAVIDLFTGTAELLKAGAAPTLLRRSGKTGKAQSTSLPAGILQDVEFDRAQIDLEAGDILLLVSDGVVCTGTDWICEELELWENGSAQELAEKLAICARSRRDDGHSDDITVISAIIQKAG